MRFWISILFIFTLFATSVSAQGKLFTLEDLLPGGKTYTQFTPQTESRIQWMGDDLIFTDKSTLYLVNPNKPSEKKVLLTKDELNILFNKENLNLNQIYFISFPEKYSGLTGNKKDTGNPVFAMINIPDENKNVFFNLVNKKIVFELSTNKEWKNTYFCTENLSTAFTKENNLYIADSKGQIDIIAED